MKKRKDKKTAAGDKPEIAEVAEEADPTGADAESVVVAEDTVESLREKVAALEDNLLRARAEGQNLQKRAAREYAEAIRFANAELLQSILGVLDDFDRSLAAADKGESGEAVIDGVRLVHENLMKALRSHGLEEIEALQCPFDPHVHEAMMQQPSEDHAPGTVLVEIAKGYRLRERVLRPARVVVSKAVAEEEPSTAGEAAEDKDASEGGAR